MKLIQFIILLVLLNLNYAQSSNIQKKIQTDLILATKGSIIKLPEGKIDLSKSMYFSESFYVF